jgi:hypothetical protein
MVPYPDILAGEEISRFGQPFSVSNILIYIRLNISLESSFKEPSFGISKSNIVPVDKRNMTYISSPL